MNIIKSDGIILHPKVIGDADILCKILTREHGKRTFLFKGLKKSKKRSIAATEPGTIVSLIYYYHENKEIYIVNEFNIQNQFSSIKDDLHKIFHLYFLLELMEKTTGIDDYDKPFFELLKAGICTLAETEYFNNLTIFFLIHLLRYQGILPDFRFCSKCGSEILSQFTLSYTDLNPICYKCNNDKNKILDYNIQKYIKISLSNKFSNINHDEFINMKHLDILYYLILFIEGNYNIELKSKKFILSGKYL